MGTTSHSDRDPESTPIAVAGLLILALLGSCAVPAPAPGILTLGLSVTNPLDAPRPAETVRVPLSLPPGYLDPASLDWLAVFDIGSDTPREVLSDYIESSVRLSEAGDVHQVDILLRDDFEAGESRSYEIRFGQPTSLTEGDLLVEDLGNDGMGDRFRVDGGTRTYFIGHELEPLDASWNGVLSKDLYIRLEGEGAWSRLVPLSHIYGNTLEHRTDWLIDECEPYFVISPGLPRNTSVETNRLTATLTLEYDGWVQGACPPWEGLGDAWSTDLYGATVTLTFYRDLPRVDAITTLTLRRGFYNHNGFAMGGAETDLERPRVLFGDAEHTVLQGALWADSDETTDRPEFLQLDAGRFVFRRGATRDAAAPFEVLGEAEGFRNYYVVEGSAGRGVLTYFPDFLRLANQTLRHEGTQTIPVNLIAAGPSIPLMVANPIVISQTHLGDIGDVWASIAPGTYTYRLTGLLDIPFYPEAGATYDAAVERLAIPMQITLAEGLPATVNTATVTVPPPATSTPPPTATPTPTPGPRFCAPPERSISAQPLRQGSLLPLLARSVGDMEDGALVIDNRGRSEGTGADSGFFSVPGAFSLSVALEGYGYFVEFGGRSGDAEATWWGGGISSVFFDYSSMSVFDGRGQYSSDWYPLRPSSDDATLTFRFYEPCGTQFTIFDEVGDLLASVDLGPTAPPANTRFRNGLFPDWVVRFGLIVDPGAWIRVTEMSIAFD